MESRFVGQNWSSMAMSCSSSSSIFGSSPIMSVIPAVSKPGNAPCFVSRLGGSQKKLCGLETRTISNGSRLRACAIRAAKSGSVDASTDTSRGPAEVESHLALLERMTENSTASPGDGTIRDQLAGQLDPEASEEVVVSLANNRQEAESSTPAAELTISQKRNIRRRNYMNKSSGRNDAPFFAAVVGLVFVPPILILAFAVATGYVKFFP